MDKKLEESVIGLIYEEAYNPLNAKELADIFAVPMCERALFYTRLDDLVEEGILYKTKKNKFSSPKKMGMFIGKLDLRKKGFGFIVSDNKDEEDLFVSSDYLNGAMHKDKVLAKITKASIDGKRAEGEIIKVLERGYQKVVGVFQASGHFGFVVADDRRFSKDIYIPKSKKNAAKDGDKVICKISKWAQEGKNPEGEIIEVLGKSNDIGIDILSIIRQHDIPEQFPKKVLEYADQLPDEVEKEEIEKRRDFREEIVLTIDGEDAKDLDDAISIKKIENGYRLGVHIADVSHYVKENSKLDKEALKRATSVYLADRVIPMLPQKLSNGLCSLNPSVDRLTLSVLMDIDFQGKVVKHEIVEGVIKSSARMVYDDVSDIIEKNDEKLRKKYENLLDTFTKMHELALILMKRRHSRGALDFDFPESKIIMGENGKIKDIKKFERRIANRIIEEFMLVCNETVAEQFYWLEMPFVYRIHENPDTQKIVEFNKFISLFGYSIKGEITDDLKPKALQQITEKLKGSKEEMLISTLMLRSLKQAKYSSFCVGHFGLAAKFYSHFTSPIRRYPDLMIHRIIKEFINGKVDAKRKAKLATIVESVSIQSSERERAADDAERDVEDLKKAEFMLDKIGNEYEGFVSGITSFGMFIELENTVEGRVSLTSLKDDYYIFKQEIHTLVGEKTQKSFKIGDRVKIKVTGANKELKEIDFEIVEKF